MAEWFTWLTPSISTLLIDGAKMTVVLTLTTSLVAFGLGIFISWLRFHSWGQWLALAYVEVFRNIPALVLVIFFAYALPNLVDIQTRREIFFRNDVMLFLREETGILIPYYAIATAVAISLNTSAYIAELLRAGMNTLNRNQIEAARALGASPNRVFFRLMLPQGIRASSPTLTTRLVHHLKNTVLGSFVAVPELFKATQTAISRTFYAMQLLILVSIIYLGLTWSYALLLRMILPSSRSQKSEGQS